MLTYVSFIETIFVNLLNVHAIPPTSVINKIKKTKQIYTTLSEQPQNIIENATKQPKSIPLAVHLIGTGTSIKNLRC